MNEGSQMLFDPSTLGFDSPYVTVLHRKTAESQPYIPCGPQLLTVVRDSYARNRQRMLTVP